MKKIHITILVIFLLLVNGNSFADEINTMAGISLEDDFAQFDSFNYVYDLAGVLDDTTELEVTTNNSILCKECRAQIVVITVNHTVLPLQEYSKKAFNRIGIGDSILNNGILLVLAIEDDNYWLSTGGDENGGIDRLYHEEEIIRDFSDYLEPFFANKEYSEGAKSMFKVLYWRISKIYGLDIPYYTIEAINLDDVIE